MKKFNSLINIQDFKVYAAAEQDIKKTKSLLPKTEKKSLELKRVEDETIFAKVIFKLTIGPKSPASLLNDVKKGLDDANPLSTTNKAKMMMKSFC